MVSAKLTREVPSSPHREFPMNRAEKPVYLDTVFAFDPPMGAPAPSPPPFQTGDGITFSCINRLSKISPGAMALWAAILKQVPDSRLLVKYHGLDDAATRGSFLASMIAAGIRENLLLLFGGTPQREHLETYGRIDISLDTFPQSGGITTVESLWMGVPVLGLFGSRKLATRLIGVLHRPLGLQDWVAEDEDSYVRLAIDWAARRQDLGPLRFGLRQRVAEVYSRFPAQVEQAYRTMWRRWCAGQNVAPISPVNPGHTG